MAKKIAIDFSAGKKSSTKKPRHKLNNDELAEQVRDAKKLCDSAEAQLSSLKKQCRALAAECGSLSPKMAVEVGEGVTVYYATQFRDIPAEESEQVSEAVGQSTFKKLFNKATRLKVKRNVDYAEIVSLLQKNNIDIEDYFDVEPVFRAVDSVEAVAGTIKNKKNKESAVDVLNQMRYDDRVIIKTD